MLVAGEGLAAYGFGGGHPFGPDRQEAFLRELRRSPACGRLRVAEPGPAARDDLETFHDREYVEFVMRRSSDGRGYLDGGDTPASPGIFEASCLVVGGTLAAVEALVEGSARRAFIPIAGLHHAARDRASGFCVFNDCGVAVERLRRRHGVQRIAYVDIDAHHGDGVYYAYEDDPDLICADIHEDGAHLFPGTGAEWERGTGRARGTKLNLPLPPGAGDREFRDAWRRVEAHLLAHRPEFILLQCGADGLAGDPLTHLALSEEAHAHAAASVCRIADELGHGRVVALGGGGYDRGNLARAWTRVVEALVAE